MRGFLGTHAGFGADLNLVIQVAMGVALIAGMFLARAKPVAFKGSRNRSDTGRSRRVQSCEATAVQYRTLCEHCTEPWLRALLVVAYTFGFRKGELLGLRVRQVSLAERTITLEAGNTKNGDARFVAMTEEVFQLLTMAVRGKGQDDFVFSREDRSPVLDMRASVSERPRSIRDRR